MSSTPLPLPLGLPYMLMYYEEKMTITSMYGFTWLCQLIVELNNFEP